MFTIIATIYNFLFATTYLHLLTFIYNWHTLSPRIEAAVNKATVTGYVLVVGPE